jgi:hypothetical protein
VSFVACRASMVEVGSSLKSRDRQTVELELEMFLL